jgi:hypothetical protein
VLNVPIPCLSFGPPLSELTACSQEYIRHTASGHLGPLTRTSSRSSRARAEQAHSNSSCMAHRFETPLRVSASDRTGRIINHDDPSSGGGQPTIHTPSRLVSYGMMNIDVEIEFLSTCHQTHIRTQLDRIASTNSRKDVPRTILDSYISGGVILAGHAKGNAM